MNNKVSRLSPPVVPDSVISRMEVNKAIDAAMHKNVVFVHAPAGFGKTIAICMWLSTAGINAAWIPLTVYDDDPSVFCRYILSALSDLDDGIAITMREALGDPGFTDAPFEHLFRAVSAVSGDNTKGVIVLDDFHLLENTAIMNTLPLIIRKLSQVYKIAILSRSNPPVSLADMALKNEMGELNENDLRFTGKQIIRLYRNFGIDISPGEAADIEEKTGGWALGLGAKLLSIKTSGSDSFLSQESSEKYIDGYLKKEIWDKWSAATQEFLLRTSILEDLIPELCDRLCGYGSENTLLQLMNGSGLAVRLPDGSYRYHHILRDFLRRTAQNQGIDLSEFYIASAGYLLEKGNSNAALDYAVKSGDFEAIASALYQIVGYETTIKSVEEFCNSVFNSVLKRIPAAILESNVYALTPCTLASNLNGDLDLFYKWRSIVNSHLELEEDVDPWLLTGIWLYEFVTPANSIRDILRLASGRFNALSFDNLPSPVVTCNFPFFHRSHRDYSDFANDWEELVPEFISAFNTISGNIVFLLTFGLVCGVLYEQNKLSQAKEKAIELLSRLDENLNPELWFSAYMHLAAIEFAESNDVGVWDVMHKAQAIVERDSLYLLKNLNAMATKYKIYKGDREAAREWLAQYAIDDGGKLKFYQIYQAFTTIRSEIALGDFSPALLLMAKLEKLVTDYHRPLDRIEVLVLRAILLWKQKQRAAAIDSMEKAALLAQPYGFTRVFANEGAAILQILKKLYNRLADNPDRSDTLIFVRTVILLATESAEVYPGITSGLEEAPVKLSKQQMRMLLLLAAGNNNQQICEETGLKLNTVKAHLFKLYEKLEVNSAADAVLKARRIGIIGDTVPEFRQNGNPPKS